MSLSPLARSVIENRFQKDPVAYRLYSKNYTSTRDQFMKDINKLQEKIDALREKTLEYAALHGLQIQEIEEKK